MGDCIIKLDIWCILFLQGSDSKIEILKKQDFIAPLFFMPIRIAIFENFHVVFSIKELIYLDF